jgi:hypothetical protein
VVDGYPQNVTALVDATVNFSCPIISELEPYIEWVKTSQRVEDGTDPMDVTISPPYQVRVGMVQVRSGYGAGAEWVWCRCRVLEQRVPQFAE